MSKMISIIVNTIIITLGGNLYLFSKNDVPIWVGIIFLILALVLCIKPIAVFRGLQSNRLKRCDNGVILLCSFLSSFMISLIIRILTIVDIGLGIKGAEGTKEIIIDTAIVILVEAIVFWAGMIRVYISSFQLGVKWRVIGFVCGMIPIINLVVLGKILYVVSSEVKVENEKILLNISRKSEEICKTKYPLLMVHGVFFRDFAYFNYWGRIPKELEDNGAKIFYGNHQSALSVEESAKEIADRVRGIIEETGCEKLNIIAHSKGGLDTRYALSELGIAPYVASLTTVNTPHRGCEFADYLLNKIPDAQKNAVASAYNNALKKLGDSAPDFMSAVTDLTASKCKELNKKISDAKGVYIQSIGSCMKKSSSGRFPLNFSHKLVNVFDGENDGLVGKDSFKWGENYTYISVDGKRGISHGDVIDLNRENFKEFDVREFYVQLVKKLKDMGY